MMILHGFTVIAQGSVFRMDEGASIEIIQNDIENNILYLSLKEENGQFSHYYNFIIDNKGNKEGIIYIKNLLLQLYRVIVNAFINKFLYWSIFISPVIIFF